MKKLRCLKKIREGGFCVAAAAAAAVAAAAAADQNKGFQEIVGCKVNWERSIICIVKIAHRKLNRRKKLAKESLLFGRHKFRQPTT
jgi:hypothetical protein